MPRSVSSPFHLHNLSHLDLSDLEKGFNILLRVEENLIPTFMGLLKFAKLPIKVALAGFMQDSQSVSCLECSILKEMWFLFFVISFINILIQYYLLPGSAYSYLTGRRVLFSLSVFALNVLIYNNRVAAWSTYTKSELLTEVFTTSFRIILVSTTIFTIINKILFK